MESLCCLTCKNRIDHLRDGFFYARELIIKNDPSFPNDVKIEKVSMDPTYSVVLEPVFQLLNIDKYCCRKSLLTSRNIKFLEREIY